MRSTRNMTSIAVLTFIMAFVFSLELPMSLMATALTANRDTPIRVGELFSYTQASNHIYVGSIVCINSSGTALPGADATGLTVAGRAEVESDNDSSDYLSTRVIEVRRGVFLWANGDVITDADIGSVAYVTDDQTVQVGVSTYNIIAGLIVDVDSDGVWVDSGSPGGIGASAPTSLAVSGNAAITGTLGVTGASTFTGALGAQAGTFAATLAVAGASTFTGALGAQAGTFATTLAVTGITTLSGGQVTGYANKTAGYTVLTTDHLLSFNSSSNTTCTLLEASTALGQEFIITLQDDDGDLIVDTDGTDTFDGTNNRITFTNALDGATFVPTAANVFTVYGKTGGVLSTQ